MVDVSGEETGSKIPQDELNRITDDLITAFKTVFDGVQDVEVRLTFDPPWDPSRMSDEARLALNML